MGVVDHEPLRLTVLMSTRQVQGTTSTFFIKIMCLSLSNNAIFLFRAEFLPGYFHKEYAELHSCVINR